MNRAPLMPIVQVDAHGKTAEGEDVNFHASAEQVRLGHMVNVKVLAQYPTGEIREGNLIQITRKGLEFLRRELPVELRKPEGSA